VASVSLYVAEHAFVVTHLSGHERLGEAASFEVDVVARDASPPAELVGKPVLIEIEGGATSRSIPGVVWAATAHATTQASSARHHRLTVRSRFALLELSQRTRVFQHMTTAEIVKEVLEEAGYASDGVETQLAGEHATHDYIVRYRETDAAFVRRLCEEEGLYFWFEDLDGEEKVIVEDDSTHATSIGTLPVVDSVDLARDREAAFEARVTAARRVGKVTLRDFDHENPALLLEGVAEAGTDAEKSLELYLAPGRFRTEAEGETRAKLRLEAVRTTSRATHFSSNCVRLAPGLAVELEPAGDLHGTARPAGSFLVIALSHRYSADGRAYGLSVEAIPLDVPYRLPLATAKPRIAGVHPATVTGPPGSEIHPDKLDRVFIRFPWDREGPSDDKSSLPVRVLQPDLPGPLAIPRVGWEVLVAFEDGDPNRPVVLGKSFNAKQPPPHALPMNKTITSWATLSSPGGAGQNSIFFDDASGRQLIQIDATKGKTTTVTNDLKAQTAKSETLTVDASQARTVGADEHLSVTENYVSGLGSQTSMVGGMQSIYVKGNLAVGTGSETVVVGGAVLEKVGNPVTGAANLAVSAALAGVGSLGVAGQAFAAAGGVARAGITAYQSGGTSAALTAMGMAAGGAAADLIPGGSALFNSVNGLANPPPWREPPAAGGEQTAGGGTAATSATSAAQGPGPGHRNTDVRGVMTELIGATCAIVTPGNVGWTTTGAATIMVAGSHKTLTRTAVGRVLGASNETLGSLKVTCAGDIKREVGAAASTSIAGALKCKAGGLQVLSAGGALTLSIGGTLTLKGSTVSFVCGSSTVTAAPGGVLIKADTVEITGKTKQSAKTTHG
jgi:type VI secretion system secreted protein VgrG